MELNEYFLNPGELIFSKKPIVIKTVLGSCVGVSIYDRVHQFGGMCHYLLPDSGGSGASTKYGNVALTILINRFLEAGSDINDLEAHVSGGAFIIFNESEIFFIGDRNVDIANRALHKYQIKIKSTNTGGEQGKKVLFNTVNGKILVQNIKVIDVDDLYKSDL